MEAKSHCKVHYGDGDDDEEVELDEFYDYSSRLVQFQLHGLNYLSLKTIPIKFARLADTSNLKCSLFLFSYVDDQGKQLVASCDASNNVELAGGSELIITTKSGDRSSTKTLGSREFLRYYRQKPRPSLANMAITAALASRSAFRTLFSISL